MNFFHKEKILSNTTLDAAKTNRAVQLLQSETSEEALFALAFGSLTGLQSPPRFVTNRFTCILRGLCKAFSEVNRFADTKKDLFHLRDFVLMLR
jgi:hypothetical protein